MSPLIASIHLTSLGTVRRSRSSGPDAITLIISAPSATVRVSGPMCSIDSHPDAQCVDKDLRRGAQATQISISNCAWEHTRLFCVLESRSEVVIEVVCC